MFNAPMYFVGTSSHASSYRGAQCRMTDLMECFFIAHPASGRKEGEESKRIMYYYPKSESVDKQTEITGFAEAVVNFTDNFVNVTTAERCRVVDDVPFRDVVTAKTVHVYIMVDKASFMLGIVLNKKACIDMDYTIHPPTLRSILLDSYLMFKLFFGHFTPFHQSDVVRFKEGIEYFFSRYLSLLRVYQMPLLDYFSGVQFLPLDSSLFTDIDAFTTQLTEEIPTVSKVLFLYQDKMLLYTVAKKELPPLFRYLTQNLLPMSLRTELEPTTLSSHGSSSALGKFITGPLEITTDEPIEKELVPPVVHLAENDESTTLVPFHLLAYRALNSTVCMLVKDTVTRRLMREMHSFLSQHLPPLATNIADSKQKSPEMSPEMDFHYIYFNPSSLSLRTSFLEQGITHQVPLAVHKLACDVYDKLMGEGEDFGECLVKADNEWGVFLKKATQRVLVLLLTPSGGNLTEMQDRVQHIIKTYFNAIFLV